MHGDTLEAGPSAYATQNLRKSYQMPFSPVPWEYPRRARSRRNAFQERHGGTPDRPKLGTALGVFEPNALCPGVNPGSAKRQALHPAKAGHQEQADHVQGVGTFSIVFSLLERFTERRDLLKAQEPPLPALSEPPYTSRW